jgi:tRNA-2-methylthio-N6-dimethylallyladenosine synthase
MTKSNLLAERTGATPAGLSLMAGGLSPGGVRHRKLYVKTYGCQMNVYDTERMIDALAPHNISTTDDITDADIIVLNTCHIREKAADKVYSTLGRIRDLREERAKRGLTTSLAVAGCVAQAEGAEILRRAPYVDVVVGPQSYHRLPALLDRVARDGQSLVDIDFPEDDKFQHLPPKSRKPVGRINPTAFLTVQEGCDKFCTFCVVPYTRGAEYSRPVAQILDEARRLVDRGVREVTLLGQNVNAYYGEGSGARACTLPELLMQLSAIDGLARLRYTTSHPRDMTDALIDAHRDLPKLMPYLHLPFQSGSDRVLAAMNRKHTAKNYLVLIERVRDVRPDIALSTDIIVGFPGETDAEFEATLGIVRHVGFAQSYSFKYSSRPGTPAASIEGQVPERVRAERLGRLQELLVSQQRAFNTSCVGRTLPVLLEKKGREPGQVIGRSPYLQGVHMPADERLIGEIVDVDIVGAGPNSLAGVIKA